jgi:hypothetical protein
MINNKVGNQTIKSMRELKPAIKMNTVQAHAILGHSSKDITWQTAAALDMQITRGALKTCKPCAIAKAKQKNLNNKSEEVKADKFNGCVYHKIATVKESNKDKKLGRKTVWHIMAEETVNFKQSTFFVYKGEMLTKMCAFMHQEKVCGHPIEII